MIHIAQAASGASLFFHILHRGGVWLSRDDAQEMGEAALRFTQSYSSLAGLCFDAQLNRFSLAPSLHYMHHFFIDVKHALQDPERKWVSSPMVGNTEADEDFIGKASRLSRHVHAGVTTSRTISRYLLKMHFVLIEGQA